MKTIQNILLYLLFFSLNYEVWDPFNTNGLLSVVKLAGLFYFLSTIIQNFRGFIRIDRKMYRIILPLVLFFCLLSANNLIHATNASVQIIYSSFLQWIVFMIIIINHGRMRPQVISFALLWFALGSVVLMILYNLGVGIDYNARDAIGRATIFGDNQNSVGLRMAISSIIIIYFTFINPLKLRPIYRYSLLISTLGLLYFLIQTGSRVALASILLMLIVSIFLMKGMTHSRKILLGGGLCLMVLVAVIYVQNSSVMLDRVSNSVNEGDLAGRDYIWQRLIPLIGDHPILGVGQTGYEEYASKIGLRTLEGATMSPHNVFLEILCYTGLVGLFLYLLFQWRQLRIAFSYYKRSDDFLCLLFFIPIAGVMLSGQILGVKLFWCIYASIISLSLYRYPYNRTLK